MTYVHGTESAEQQRLVLMNRLINEPTMRELDLAAGQRVLDVGCGLAVFSRMAARAVMRGGGAVVAVERDDRQRAEALRLAEADGEAGLVDLRAGDAMHLPLPDAEWGSFDVVYGRFLLEHLTDPLGAVRQMVGAARPGGRIVLQDDEHDVLRLSPSCEPLEASWRAYWQTYDDLGTDPHVGRRLPSLLHQAGAKPSRITQIFYGACQGHPDFEGVTANMIGVLEGAEASVTAHGRMDATRYRAGITAFRRWRGLPDAAMWYCMFYAEGIRQPPSPKSAS